MRKDYTKEFYRIADNSPTRLPDVHIAMRIVDRFCAPCSADSFNEALARECRIVLPDLVTPEFIAWAKEIQEDAEKPSDHDLRGYPKNVHIRG